MLQGAGELARLCSNLLFSLQGEINAVLSCPAMSSCGTLTLRLLMFFQGYNFNGSFHSNRPEGPLKSAKVQVLSPSLLAVTVFLLLAQHFLL